MIYDLLYDGPYYHMQYDGPYYHMMDWNLYGWGAFGWIFMIIGMGVFFGVAILMAYYVHKDALNKRIPNAEIWVLVVLIFNILGLIIYLVLRGNYPKAEVKDKKTIE